MLFIFRHCWISRSSHLERGENTRAAVSTTINHSVFRSSLSTTILSFSLSLFLSFFFFLRFGQFSMEESGVIVRSQCEQQARQKPDEPVDSLGKHLTKNDARSPRAVSTPTASFCFNPLRSTLSATTHTNTCQRRVRGRNCGIYDQFYSRLSFSSLTFCLSVCPSCLSSLFLLLF